MRPHRWTFSARLTGHRPVGSSADGFMLVDLLVTMVVLGILAAMAIPQYFNQINRAYDRQAISLLRTGLISEIDYMWENPDEGYMDLWQNSTFRQQQMAQIEGTTTWYDGWSGASPAVLQVDVRAGHINSGSLVDDWLMLTVLSRSGTCLTLSREDTTPLGSSGLAVGTFYWKGASSNGTCPSTPAGNLPPTTAPATQATATSWGTGW